MTLCKRIIAVILLQDGRAVKSRKFGAYRDVGNPASRMRILYANGADELVILNTQPKKGIQPLLDVLDYVPIPVAAGGGITTVDQVGELIMAGCEKVVIRTHTELIPAITKRYGCQAVIECRDYGSQFSSDPTQAGELMLQSVDRDGMMQGYDSAPIVADVPVIRLGGCGTYQHMLDAFTAGADACAAGSLWDFTDSAPNRAKSWLKNHGISVRQ